LGGYKIQGRGEGADQLLADAHAIQEAGAFAVVLEMVPGALAGQVTKELAIPTIGIGAGPECDAQVLVWQDMAGLNTGKVPRFVKQYADLDGVLREAAAAYATDVRSRSFPGHEHTYG
jgi:3-methyl-2-oxobutanoate hydroxymethyltransferase